MSQSSSLIKELGILFLSALMGLVAGSILAYIGLYTFFGFDVATLETWMLDTENPNKGSVLRWMQLSSTGFGFVLGGFTYLQWNKNEVGSLFSMSENRKLPFHFFAWAGLLVVLLSPAVAGLQILNQSIVFPEFLAEWEASLMESQAMAEQQIKALIGSPDEVSFLYLLFIMAVLPALGEELIFRVGLQDILQRHLGTHAGVLLASVLFALVHQQFYNVLPMIFLALLLGYAYAIHRSIVLNFFLHFIHNAYTLITVRILGLETDKGLLDHYLSGWLSMSLAFAATIFVVLYFRNKLSSTTVKPE